MLAIVFALLQGSANVAVSHAPSAPGSPGGECYGCLPLAFEENRGQAERAARFLAHGRDYQIHLSSNAVALAVAERRSTTPAESTRAMRLRFLGARHDGAGTGIEPRAFKTNYFLGNGAAERITDVPSYSRIRFDDVYPGIAIVYYGREQQLEYDVVVSPGADANLVRFAVDGVDRMRLDAKGDLQLALGSGTISLKRPLVYQDYDGVRHPVKAWFERRAGNQVVIRTERYDHEHALTIDPVLSYGSYLGGSKDEYGEGIAVDGSGNAYLTGYTYSSDFPLLSAYQSSLGRAGSIGYVTKLNASGTGVIYSTYLGDVTTRSGRTQAFAIAVDSSGNAYVTGTTTAGFPTTAGAYQTSATIATSFVAKLGPAGNTLIYGTFVQGSTASSIAVDAGGNAYVAGSAWTGFKTTTGAYQTSNKATGTNGTNAFVVKLNPTGTAALYATFLGGSYNNTTGVTNGDSAAGIAVDASGNAYVGGGALSSDFPLTANAFQSGSGSGEHGFITKLNPQGTGLVYSARLGGSQAEGVTGLALDTAGNVYATGWTTSSNFPLTPSAFKTVVGANGGSGFVTKLSPDGRTLGYSSLLADNNLLTPPGGAIAVDSGGRAFVASEVGPSPGMALVNDLLPGQPSNATAMYVAKISALGDTALYATHIGWSTEAAFGIAVDKNGDAYATGTAYFGDLFTDTVLLSSGAFQTTHTSSDLRDAIAVKLTTGAPLTATLLASSTNLTSGQSFTATATVMYASGGSGSGLPGSVIFYDGLTQLVTVPLASGTASATLTLPVGIHSLAAVYRNSGAEAVSGSTYIVVNPPATCQ
jgi:beta-propeller repeat-containing protein